MADRDWAFLSLGRREKRLNMQNVSTSAPVGDRRLVTPGCGSTSNSPAECLRAHCLVGAHRAIRRRKRHPAAPTTR
jgi:hypothetical protein